MTRFLVSATALLLTVSCAKPQMAQTPQAPTRDIVTLAPDPESGEVGRVTVTTPKGRIELAERNASTTVVGGGPPAPASVMSDQDVERLFGAVLRGQAPPALRYLLYFELGTDTLTPESKVEVLDVIEAVRKRVADSLAQLEALWPQHARQADSSRRIASSPRPASDHFWPRCSPRRRCTAGAFMPPPTGRWRRRR